MSSPDISQASSSSDGMKRGQVAMQLAHLMPRCRKWQDRLWESMMAGESGWHVLRVKLDNGRIVLDKQELHDEQSMSNGSDD